MLQILPPDKTILGLVGSQKVAATEYRPFTYVFSTPIDDGLLLYNVLTKQILWVSESESEFFDKKFDIENQTVQKLIAQWFLVPSDFADSKLANQIRNMKEMFAFARKSDVITSFVIFTTTDCNARCYYCYEHGSKKINMSPKTAGDVADFIIKKSKGNKVSIKWFGGEPLYNIEAIDIICDKLNENNIDFTSRMISNGYLFDSEMAKRFDNWHFKEVQITLDGAEEEYNRIKAYIYKDNSSPFKRVTDNIELLLQNDIAVKIRLNIDIKNIESMYKLIPYLIERYKQYPKCKIYPIPVTDYNSIEIPDIEKRITLKDAQSKMFKLILDAGMYELLDPFRKSFNDNNCMADSDSSTTILPDGKLGKCEHYLDSDYWGDIYSDDIDRAVINSFKAIRKPFADCEDCLWYPGCTGLDKCSALLKYCDEFTRNQMKQKADYTIIKAYNKYIKENSDEA